MRATSCVECARVVADARATRERREAAERELAAATRDGACALELLRAVTTSDDGEGEALTAAERQTCGVLAANALGTSWRGTEATTREACRAETLRALFPANAGGEDGGRGGRASMRAFVNCVDVLAQCGCAEGGEGWEWRELWTALDAASASGEASHREASARTYAMLCESLGARMVSEHERLLVMFVRMVSSDEDANVRYAALDGVGKLAGSWCVAPTLGPALSACAVELVRCAERSLEIGDGRLLGASLEAMSALVGAREDVYGAHNAALIQILELALRLGTNPKLDAGSIRAPALLILTKMAKKHAELLTETMAGQIDLQYDPHVLGQGGPISAALVPPLLTISLEAEERSFDDEDVEGEGLDEQSSSPAALARGALRALASTIPNHFVVAPALNLLERLRGGANAPAAWRVFAAITEGTQGEGVTSHLPVLIPELTETMKCVDVNLRVAAMEAMCMMATHCQPEMADEYAGTTFSLIASMLTHAPRSCQWAVHGALSKMCENSLGEAIAPLIVPLIEALKAQTMDLSWRTAARATHSFGAVAQCSLDYFTPYASDILSLLLARAKSAEQTGNGTELQARSVATMATILGVVGIERAPNGLLELLLQTAASALTSADTIARECAHECLGKLAVALEDKFEPYAIDAASAAVAALAQTESASHRTAITTGVVEEQMAAAEALGQYFNSGVVCLRPFLPTTLEALAFASDTTRPTPLRLAAIRALEFIFSPWSSAEKGDVAFLALSTATIKLLCERVRFDPDAAVVLAAIQGISELLDKAKTLATLPMDVLEGAKDAAEVVIRWQSVCQIEFEAKEDAAENDDDDESDDNDIFDSMVFWAERIAPQDEDSD